MPSTATTPTAMPPTSLTARIHELVSACFTGIWLETCEPEGTVNMKTTGFTGGSCREATRELIKQHLFCKSRFDWAGHVASMFR